MTAQLIIPFFIPHAGCPFTCVFCNQWEISGATNITTPEQIRPQVLQYLDAHGLKTTFCEVAFYGGSFTGLEQEQQNDLLEAAFELKREGLIQGIRLSTRPDYINQQIVENLLAYGVTTVELGVQSLVEPVLSNSCRGYGVETVEKAVQLLREYPLTVILQLMLGLPGDTREYALFTAKKTIALAPDGVRIYPTLVMKGTTLEKWYQEGRYQSWSLMEAVDVGAQWFKLFTANEIKVIRLGLQAADNLSPEHDLVTGPYHPSYGELVQSKVMLEQLEFDLAKMKDKGKKLTIYCNPRDISKVTGQKRINLQSLQDRYSFTEIEVKAEPGLEQLSLRLVTEQEQRFSSRKEFLKQYRTKGKGQEVL
ncbi:MAG: radical SAM protein [Peptococcia bacterium]